MAISGRADSVALLLLFLELGYDLEAVHCNFHLRGEDSDCDERFVADLCEKKEVVLHKVHFDTRQYAALHKKALNLQRATCDIPILNNCVTILGLLLFVWLIIVTIW